METLKFTINSISPILLLVALGYFIKRLGFGDDNFYKKVNSLVFKLFLPMMLFHSVYEIESISDINWGLIAFVCLAVLLLAFIGLVVAKAVTKDRGKIAVITQCSFRSNHAIIGLPLAESIGGQGAIAFASVAGAVAIPLYNVLAVVVLSYFSGDKKQGRVKSTLINTAKNPLIISVLIGVIILGIRSLIPLDETGAAAFTIEKNIPFLMSAVSMLAKVASPLALVTLGARFDFSAVKGLLKEISVSTLLRLVFSPLIGILGAYLISSKLGLFPVLSTDYPGLIALFGSPVAVSSAVMVSEIGGDDQLATQLVVWTSVLSVFTVFAIVFLLKYTALI